MRLSTSEKNQKDRQRVVVDTSVLMSATLIDGADRKLIRELVTSNFEICIPKEIIEEYRGVVARPKFKRYEPLFMEILDELKKSAVILPLASVIKYEIKNSPEDEAIINCCVENHIDYLITYDRKIIGRYNGLEVLIANDFYNRFLGN